MTEEVGELIALSDGRRWVLSGTDQRLLHELLNEMWNWLPDVADGREVVVLGTLISGVEALIEEGTPPPHGTAEVNLKPAGRDGLGVLVEFDPEEIVLSAFEYVWCQVAVGRFGHDHGAVRDREGGALMVSLTPDGSFDQGAFERWLDLARRSTDQQVHGHGSCAHAAHHD